MMGDLTVSEKRLIAALDRIDRSIERAASGLRAVADADAGAQSQPQDGDMAGLQVRLDEMHEKLGRMGAQAARLAAANEGLSQANRLLLSKADSGGIGADEERAALEAEIEALRAARDAEIGQVGDILQALDGLLGASPDAAGTDSDENDGEERG